MKTQVLIGFLLVCATAGLPLNNASEKTPQNYDLCTKSDGVMCVYDDDENLVRLRLDDDDEEDNTDLTDIENFVFFLLYTRKNPLRSKPLYVDDEDALKRTKFDPALPTRFVTHGWMNSRKSAACTLIRDAYLKHGDYNIIVIDWSKISIKGYIWASNRVKRVGEFVSRMIDFLSKHQMELSETIVVGHSLGAHVAGIAARNAKGEVKSVIGLDPALPRFELVGPGSRISSDDAEYVEIIHTNGGFLGFLSAIGDADFYPNGGKKQHGCLTDPGGACSHARSFRFFAESITSTLGFHGRSCSSYRKFKRGRCNDSPTSIMGGHKSLFIARGKYYLKTKSKFPFAKGPFEKFRRLNSTI